MNENNIEMNFVAEFIKIVGWQTHTVFTIQDEEHNRLLIESSYLNNLQIDAPLQEQPFNYYPFKISNLTYRDKFTINHCVSQLFGGNNVLQQTLVLDSKASDKQAILSTSPETGCSLGHELICSYVGTLLGNKPTLARDYKGLQFSQTQILSYIEGTLCLIYSPHSSGIVHVEICRIQCTKQAIQCNESPTPLFLLQ